ncbi:MAG: trimethylamine methyltransferase family protein [Desulfamplus sp.]|nr:trimethylamine methyltransferase family protein [Desulfamplus sp.]
MENLNERAFLTDTTLDKNKFQKIHKASLEILKERGLWVGSEALVATAKSHGLKTDGEKVFFTEYDVEKAILNASSSNRFTLLARNPKYNIDFNIDYSATGIGRSAPFIFDPSGKRRQADGNDYISAIKLGQMLDAVQIQGNLVYPGNVSNDKLFPFMMANQILYSDKPYNISSISDLEMLCMAFDITPETLKKRDTLSFASTSSNSHNLSEDDKNEQINTKKNVISYAQSTVNCISPLILAGDQGDFLIAMAEHGIAISISPCPSAGMTGPCSVLGNVILNNCEVLSILVLTQLIKPGLPIFYGAFPCSCDMKSMSITYGGPESRMMESGAALMGKAYGLLTRGNVGMNDAQACDFHAGAESMFCFINALQNKINFLPGCGIMSSFAAASLEKLIMDADLAAYTKRFLEPITTDDIDELVELIKTVDPKINFVTSPHTFTNFRKALHHPTLFWRTNYDKWEAKGKTLIDQAAERVSILLKTYSQPPIDLNLASRLKDYTYSGE